MIVAERSFAERNRLEQLARLVAYGVAAVEPGLFGIGPVPAVRQALERAHWTLADVERVEINEAFAAVPLAVLRELSLPEDIVNVEGGAIAHGHPIGATGAVLTTRLLHSMRRDGLKRGVVTLCIGGGQGIALALESESAPRAERAGRAMPPSGRRDSSGPLDHCTTTSATILGWTEQKYGYFPGLVNV